MRGWKMVETVKPVPPRGYCPRTDPTIQERSAAAELVPRPVVVAAAASPRHPVELPGQLQPVPFAVFSLPRPAVGLAVVAAAITALPQPPAVDGVPRLGLAVDEVTLQPDGPAPPAVVEPGLEPRQAVPFDVRVPRSRV